jgi:hypothetical protein
MAAVTIEGLKWDRLRCGDSARTSLEECDAAAGHRVVFSVFSCVRNKNVAVLTLKSTVQTFFYTFAVQSEVKILLCLFAYRVPR